MISNFVRSRYILSLSEGQWPFDAPFGYKSYLAGKKIRTNYDRFGGMRQRAIKLKAFSVDPHIAECVKRLFEGYAAGNMSRVIMMEMEKEYGITFVARYNAILRNKFYIGIMEYDGIEYPHGYGNVIDLELFSRVQSILSKRSGKSRKMVSDSMHFLFKGWILCMQCQKYLSGYQRKSIYTYYKCASHKNNISEPDVIAGIQHFIHNVDICLYVKKESKDFMADLKKVVIDRGNITKILPLIKRIEINEARQIVLEIFDFDSPSMTHFIKESTF